MINRLPLWFRQEIPSEATLEKIRLLSKFNVHTVCQEAKCPNLSYCFRNLKFTFMILGDTCTRNCQFCAVDKSKNAPLTLDNDEPYRIARLVKMLGLDYVVITSVTRDDLCDGGAAHFAKTISLIHGINRNIKAEVLIPDFKGKISSLQCILDAKPDVVAHNIETVKRLSRDLRPKADYKLSLDALGIIKKLNPSLITKSSIMLGMGETEREVIDTMKDLRNSECDILTLGQYLSPSIRHYSVKEFIAPERFLRYQSTGLGMGFKAVLSGPKVRSSYQAENVFEEVNLNKPRPSSKSCTNRMRDKGPRLWGKYFNCAISSSLQMTGFYEGRGKCMI